MSKLPFQDTYFDTYAMFTDYCATTEPGEKWMARKNSSFFDEDGPSTIADKPSRWNGNLMLDEAIELAQNGWPEGLNRIKKILLEEEANTEVDRLKWQNSVVGIRPNVPAYCAGVPTNMMRINYLPVVKPIVRIVAYMQVNCNVSAQTYANQGAAIASLVDGIEDTGTSVELTLAYASYSREVKDFYIRLFVNLKQSTQPLDMDRLAFAIIHPSFFRRMVFRWYEQDKYYDAIHSGYGTSCYAEESVENTEKGVFAIEPIQGEISFGAALEKVREQYKKFCEKGE